MNGPKVTVLMAVHNSARYLNEAIKSILDQTFADFEFLIINDGSTDDSVSIIQSYNDERIRLVHNEMNVGLTRSLNLGLDLSRGRYIARMDADDISLPERLAKQFVFLETHPDVGVCGTWIMTMGDQGGCIWKHPPDDETIRCRMIFEPALAHPSVMFRKDLLDHSMIRYDPHCRFAQDYELWVRCSHHMRLANIDEVLVHYRVHERNVSRSESNELRSIVERVWLTQLTKLGIHPTAEEIRTHRAIATWKFPANDWDFLNESDRWLRKITDANNKAGYYPEPVFSMVLAERWFAVCCACIRYGKRTWKKYRSSPLSTKASSMNWRRKLKYIVKYGLWSLEKNPEDIEGSVIYSKLARTKLSNYFR